MPTFDVTRCLFSPPTFITAGCGGTPGPATLKATRRFDGLQVGANALLLPGVCVSRRSPDPSGAIV